MSTKFLKQARNFNVVDSSSLNVHDVLPPGNYVIKQTPEGVLYLHVVEDFTHPPKMYGTTVKHAGRILSTFKKRPRGTGVLLSGEKGSGKTLLARTVCIEAAKEGIPTIIINAPWQGDSFFTFLSAITQPCIVLFDEFEKVYDVKKNEQDSILTLLDGVFPSKKLFLLTCNDRHGINMNMINRPGRIYYSMEFHGLSEDFIREYAQDNLVNKNYVEDVARITTLFSEFNFDMLQALIEEMNHYNENPTDALQLLNVSPVHDYATYKTNVLLGTGETVSNDHTGPHELRSPLAQKNGISMEVYYTKAGQKPPTKKMNRYTSDDDDSWSRKYIKFFPADVISSTGDSIVLKNKDGDILTLTKEKFNYDWRETASAIVRPETEITE